MTVSVTSSATDALVRGRQANIEVPLTIRLIPSIDDIPADQWSELVGPDQPLWAQGVFRAMEHGSIGPSRFEYLAVTRGDRIVALLPVQQLPRLDLAGLLGSEARQKLRVVQAMLPRLFRINAIFAGHLLGEGRLLLAEGESQRVMVELLLPALQSLARVRGARWVVWKDMPDDVLSDTRDLLGRHGFSAIDALPDTVLDLPPGSFADFVAALPGKPRRNTRAKLRRLAAAKDIHIRDLSECDAMAGQLADLYRNVLSNAESWLEVLTPEFFAVLCRADDVDVRIMAACKGDTPVAFLLWLSTGNRAAALRVGLNYEVSTQAALYHNVHYRGIEAALERKCTTMDFFQTAYEPKKELGCRLVPLSNAVYYANPFLRRLLAAILSRAVATTTES